MLYIWRKKNKIPNYSDYKIAIFCKQDKYIVYVKKYLILMLMIELQFLQFKLKTIC